MKKKYIWIHRNTELLEETSKDTQSKPHAVHGDVFQPYQLCWTESSKPPRTGVWQGVQIPFPCENLSLCPIWIPHPVVCCGLFLVTLFVTTKNSLVSGCWKFSSTSHLHRSQIALNCISPTSTNSWTEAILAAEAIFDLFKFLYITSDLETQNSRKPAAHRAKGHVRMLDALPWNPNPLLTLAETRRHFGACGASSFSCLPFQFLHPR